MVARRLKSAHDKLTVDTLSYLSNWPYFGNS